MDLWVVKVVTDNAEDAVGPTDGGAGGIAVLDHQQARLLILIIIPHIRVAHQLLVDGALERKEAIGGIFELPVCVTPGETL